jgi:hypothetical protein
MTYVRRLSLESSSSPSSPFALLAVALTAPSSTPQLSRVGEMRHFMLLVLAVTSAGLLGAACDGRGAALQLLGPTTCVKVKTLPPKSQSGVGALADGVIRRHAIVHIVKQCAWS